MTESEFLALADRILSAIEKQADQWYDERDIDVEPERSGNVLTLVFDNGTRVVINGQAPLQEMWLASPGGAYHYRLDGGIWRDTRGGADLQDALAAICSKAADQPLTVTI